MTWFPMIPLYQIAPKGLLWVGVAVLAVLTGESLHPFGLRMRDCDFEAFRCDWKGFVFENGGVRYRIEESGLLTVRKLVDDELLVSQLGTWH